jgi:hypothetical protein
MPFNGTLSDFRSRDDLHVGYTWVNKIPNKKIYLSLFQRWPTDNLPLDYDLYIISFHLEAVDVGWLTAQSKKINKPIIVLLDGTSNNYSIPNVRFLSYYYWHIQLDKMKEWFGYNSIDQRNITHNASAFCNRITSTKLIIFTALAEYIGAENCILVLHNWLEEKNIYAKNQVPVILKNLFDIFFIKYYGNEYTVDDFTNDLNYQQHTANPWQPSYQKCALHFTNESFDTSSLGVNALYAYPGPFITEKTLKCLMGGTAFIPVGQFDTYGALRRVGFEFNYNFDLSFDNIINDNDKLIAIVELIKTLSNMPKEEIYEGTKESSEFNYNYIKGGRFYKDCELLNQHTVEQIMEHIDLVTG